jgi:hypothetical protein
MGSDPGSVEYYRASAHETFVADFARMYDRVVGDRNAVTNYSRIFS